LPTEYAREEKRGKRKQYVIASAGRRGGEEGKTFRAEKGRTGGGPRKGWSPKEKKGRQVSFERKKGRGEGGRFSD